jgi:type IV pilus assembly protein PilC
METYTYIALDGDGRTTRGLVDAEGVIAATEQLLGRGLHPLDLHERREMVSGGFRRFASNARPVTARDKVFVLRQWSLLLRAGVQLRQALATTAHTCHPRLGRTLSQICLEIEGGSSFADACSKHPRTFDGATIASLRAGEAAGNLEVVLDDLADRSERAIERRGQVITALVYPAVISLLGIAVVAFLVTSVIPRFETFFAQRGGDLPAATRALTEGATLIRLWGPWLLLSTGLVTVALVLLHRLHGVSAVVIDRLMLAVPAIGPVLRAAGMTTICSRSSMLLASGVGLPETLRIVGSLCGNRAFSLRLNQAAESVLAGGVLHRAFSRPPMPLLMGDVVRIGEEAGHLPEVLSHLSVYFGEELERKLKRLTALFEPAVLLVVGGLVGFVYLAFFQAIFAIAGR